MKSSGGAGLEAGNARIGVAGATSLAAAAIAPNDVPPGVYLVTMVATVTTAGSAGNITAVTVGWTDANGAQTRNILAANLSLTAAGTASGQTVIRHTGGSAGPTFATTTSGSTGSPIYEVRVFLTRLDDVGINV
jgi:hypothetical protein